MKLKLHQTKNLDWYSMRKCVDLLCHPFGLMTHADEKFFISFSFTKIEKWCCQWTFCVKRTWWWIFQVDTTCRFQDMASSVFFPVNLACNLWSSYKMDCLWMQCCSEVTIGTYNFQWYLLLDLSFGQLCNVFFVDYFNLGI